MKKKKGHKRQAPFDGRIHTPWFFTLRLEVHTTFLGSHEYLITPYQKPIITT